jgi:hypothetical protein
MGWNVKDLGISLFIAIVKFKVLSVYVNVKGWSWKGNNYKIKKKKSESTWLACKTRDMDNETKITS